MKSGLRRLALLAAASVLALGAGAEQARAQVGAKGAAATAAQPGAPATGKERMVVDAQEIVHDNKANTVSAVGSVQIFHQGRIIEADRVVYDRASKRVRAEGNARITEANGTVITGDKFDLNDDFKDGFIDSMRVENPDKTRFTAPRGERTNGQGMVFDNGLYTACEACKDDPAKPPLWQVRAARIIHDANEHMVYYESSRLEFWGIPLAYIPYFSAPDATVKRKSGFLMPHYITTNAMGYGVATPYFWNLAPNYDVTLTPTFLTRQGVLGEAEWRHRLENGTYNVRAAGIYQADKGAFLPSPIGAGDRDFRGSVETAGKFYINDKWSYGWDLAMATDRWFIQNYRLRTESVTSIFYRESTSTLNLTGKSDTAWFDARGYYFRTLSYTDWQKQQPIVAPVIDYNKRYKAPGWLGGEITVDANVTSLTREAAAFQQAPRQLATLFTFPSGTTLYDTCAVYDRTSCLLRGVGGAYSRASVETSWRRNIIDGYGQVWTPYASLRANGIFTSPDKSSYANNQVANFIDPDSKGYGSVMPAVGLMYRYPFVATASWGTQILEPIAQITARPNESRIRTTINEDAQSLVFDDTNLFSMNKFSGYDRTEGGVRANLGTRYTANFNKDAYFNILAGQSFQLAGTNSYNPGDVAKTGIESGLQRARSDYVAGAQFVPATGWSFSARGRFDVENFSGRRIELSASRSVGALSTSVAYARYERQPELGLDRRREGFYVSQAVTIGGGWSARGSVLFDMDKFLLDRERYYANLTNYQLNPAGYSQPAWPKSNPYYPTSLGLGVNYKDECTTFDINLTKSYADRYAGGKRDGYTLLFRLELRTLGQINYTQRFGIASTSDGIVQK